MLDCAKVSNGYSLRTAASPRPPAPPRPETGTQSLPEVFRSIAVPRTGSWLRRFLAFAGPGYLISVGYMDPGNWGTDLAGGSRFGYTLLWVILASNLMAQFLQVLAARLGLVTRKDLAMACRDYYRKPAALAMWLLCEIAIIACDLAEVVGSAVALNLLFGMPLQLGVLLTAADVLLLLAFLRFGFRKIEAIVLTLVLTVFGCFVYEIFLAGPDPGAVLRGALIPMMPNTEALLISLGILGATVMPHNLYLHSSIVQTRHTDEGDGALRHAIHANTIDTIVALSLAFFVNAAILVLAASVFAASGTIVTELQQGHELLHLALGGASATAFAVALLASGQASTITGTLAGQIVMEGFLRLRITPWLRRIITRSLAIVPALFIIHATGGKDTVQLLVISQVVLSLQLPFAIFPLMMVTSDRRRMGKYANPRWATVLGYGICTLIAALNVFLLYSVVGALWVSVAVGLVVAFAVYAKYIYKDTRLQPTPN